MEVKRDFQKQYLYLVVEFPVETNAKKKLIMRLLQLKNLFFSLINVNLIELDLTVISKSLTYSTFINLLIISFIDIQLMHFTFSIKQTNH